MKHEWIASSRAEYDYWAQKDKKIRNKINNLILECKSTPYVGKGKPEPMKHDLSGWWSRRITRTHRMVYRVTGTSPNQTLEILSCRYHYKK